MGLDQPNIKTDFPSFNFVTSSVDDSIIQTNMKFPENFMTDSYENMQNEDDDDLSEDENIDVADLDFKENYSGDDLLSKQEIDEFLLGELESEDEISETDQKFQIKMKDKYQSDIEENYQSEDFEYPPAEPSLFSQSLEKSKPWDECIQVNKGIFFIKLHKRFL